MARTTKSAEQTNPLVPLVAELGKDIGRMATAVETLVHQGNSASPSPTDNTPSTNTESHSTTPTNRGGIQDEQVIKKILRELELSRQAQKILTSRSGEWRALLEMVSRESDMNLPTRETYGVRVYLSKTNEGYGQYEATFSIPAHLVGKSGFYRFREQGREWQLPEYDATVLGETLTLHSYQGESEYIDVEFFVVNRDEFTPNEEIQL